MLLSCAANPSRYKLPICHSRIYASYRRSSQLSCPTANMSFMCLHCLWSCVCVTRTIAIRWGDCEKRSPKESQGIRYKRVASMAFSISTSSFICLVLANCLSWGLPFISSPLSLALLLFWRHSSPRFTSKYFLRPTLSIFCHHGCHPVFRIQARLGSPVVFLLMAFCFCRAGHAYWTRLSWSRKTQASLPIRPRLQRQVHSPTKGQSHVLYRPEDQKGYQLGQKVCSGSRSSACRPVIPRDLHKSRQLRGHGRREANVPRKLFKALCRSYRGYRLPIDRRRQVTRRRQHLRDRGIRCYEGRRQSFQDPSVFQRWEEPCELGPAVLAWWRGCRVSGLPGTTAMPRPAQEIGAVGCGLRVSALCADRTRALDENAEDELKQVTFQDREVSNVAHGQFELGFDFYYEKGETRYLGSISFQIAWTRSIRQNA